MTVTGNPRTDIRLFPRILAVCREGAYELLNPPVGNVPGLDALRSLAIILVVSGHYYGEFSDAHGITLAIGRFPFFYFAWTGVDLFFVLSGYLIGRQLWRELMIRNTINIPRFLLKRGLRIWPYYFLFVLWSISTSPRTTSKFLPDLFFLSNYFPGAVAGTWSLSTEEQFYIFVPALLCGVSTFIAAKRQYLVIIGLLLALPLIRYLTLTAYHGPITHDVEVRIIQLPFHTHADGLLAGVLLSWVSILKPDHLTPLPFFRNLIAPTILVAAGLLLRHFDRVFGLSSLALIFGGMTLFVLRDRSGLRKLYNGRIFYLTSRLSYGMYLNHFPILSFAVPLLVATRFSNRIYVDFFIGHLLMIFSSMMVAAVTFILIESPFLQLRERWLEGKNGVKKIADAGIEPAFKLEPP